MHASYKEKEKKLMGKLYIMLTIIGEKKRNPNTCRSFLIFILGLNWFKVKNDNMKIPNTFKFGTWTTGSGEAGVDVL